MVGFIAGDFTPVLEHEQLQGVVGYVREERVFCVPGRWSGMTNEAGRVYARHSAEEQRTPDQLGEVNDVQEDLRALGSSQWLRNIIYSLTTLPHVAGTLPPGVRSQISGIVGATLGAGPSPSVA